jgi:hypothetical protein
LMFERYMTSPPPQVFTELTINIRSFKSPPFIYGIPGTGPVVR